jgi:peptidoglycan-associated lipoprotein
LGIHKETDMNAFKFILPGLAVLLFSACSNPTVPDPDPQDSVFDSSMDDQSDASTGGMEGEGFGEGEFFDDEFADELTMVIYFDFDQSELRAEYGDLLQRHANNLANDRRSQIRLEGHADERGSREYNIGLGERRAQSVRRMLMIQGASADQISTVSFGEERPAAFGSDEESYQLNRRVEIKYIN